MSDTPETEMTLIKWVNSAALAAGLVPADFARRLERERDEARGALTEVERENDQLLASNKNYERDWPILVHERDEARADADEWQNKYAEVFVERDEARKDLDEEMKFHHRTHGECVIAQCELMDVERERDEAREAFAIAADQLVQAQSALREIHTIVQMRFAEWAPANDLNNGSEEATK